jgi:hypothetical protein
MVGSLRRAGLAKVRRLRERGEEEGRVGREWEPQISPRHAGTGPLRYRPEELWACGPPKVIKNASVQQPLSMEPLPFPLSSRPKRTRISYLVALARTTYAAFRRERRKMFFDWRLAVRNTRVFWESPL